jgi:ribosomal protein S27E
MALKSQIECDFCGEPLITSSASPALSVFVGCRDVPQSQYERIDVCPGCQNRTISDLAKYRDAARATTYGETP